MDYNFNLQPQFKYGSPVTAPSPTNVTPAAHAPQMQTPYNQNAQNAAQMAMLRAIQYQPQEGGLLGAAQQMANAYLAKNLAKTYGTYPNFPQD